MITRYTAGGKKRKMALASRYKLMVYNGITHIGRRDMQHNFVCLCQLPVLSKWERKNASYKASATQDDNMCQECVSAYKKDPLGEWSRFAGEERE